MRQARRPAPRSGKRKPVRMRWIRRQLARCWWLSSLLLAVAVAGTVWLRGLTGQGPDRAQQLAATGGRGYHPRLPSHPPKHAPPGRRRVAATRRTHPPAAPVRHWPAPRQLPARREPLALAPVATPPAGHYLVPLQTPLDSHQHQPLGAQHQGRLVLGVRLDAAGGVAGVWLAQPSGDAVLDAYALQRVRQWRFPPPAAGDRAGLLALRFESPRR